MEQVPKVVLVECVSISLLTDACVHYSAASGRSMNET